MHGCTQNKNKNILTLTILGKVLAKEQEMSEYVDNISLINP